LQIQADNAFELFINGKPVTIPSDSAVTPVTRLLQNGDNVLAVLLYQTAHPSWFMSALRARLDIEFANAPTVSVATDSSWKIVYFDFGENHPQKFAANDWTKISYEETAAWLAPGICQDSHPRWTRRAHYFRKTFHLQKRPISARMYISSRGVYEPYLNGKKISNEWLAPGVSGKVQPYRSYDVLDGLIKGDNCVGVLVGGGWWNGEGHSFLYSKKPQVLVQLLVRFKNGQESWIVSDSTWQAHPSPILEDALMNGERYDARLEIPDWSLAAADARSWSQVRIVDAIDEGSTSLLPSNLEYRNQDKPLVSQTMPSVTISEERPAVRVSEPLPGKYIFDFGQNASGRCRLKVSGASAGTPITIRYGEKLNADGTLNIDVYRDVWFRGDNDQISPFNTKNIDHYICRGGGMEYWQPRFTYTGFRYAELSGPGAYGVS
jgi:alpha-L-rhamnosidase